MTICALSPWDGLAAQDHPDRLSLTDMEYIEIGALGDPNEVAFAGLVAAVLTDEGEVVVADGGNHVLRWFDARGTLVRTEGGEGEGPGEFRGLHWLGACPGGVLLAIDPINGRGTLIRSRDGQVTGSHPVPPALGFGQPLACKSDDTVLMLLDRPVRSGSPGEVVRPAATIGRLDVASGAVDTLLTLPGTAFYFGAEVPGSWSGAGPLIPAGSLLDSASLQKSDARSAGKATGSGIDGSRRGD